MDIKKKLGNNIKEIRTNLNITQEVLAEMVDISAQSMSKIENSQNFVSADTVDALCKALNVESKDLFNFKEEKPKEDIIVEIERCLRRNPTLLKTIYKIVLALDL